MIDNALYEEIRDRLKLDSDFTKFLKSRAEVDSPQITFDNIIGHGLHGINAIFFTHGLWIAAPTWGGTTETYSNLGALRLPNGNYLTPEIVVTGTGPGDVSGSIPGTAVASVGPGTFTLESFDIGGQPAPTSGEHAPFYALAIA